MAAYRSIYTGFSGSGVSVVISCCLKRDDSDRGLETSESGRGTTHDFAGTSILLAWISVWCGGGDGVLKPFVNIYSNQKPGL